MSIRYSEADERMWWRTGVVRCCGQSLGRAAFCPCCGKARQKMTLLEELLSHFKNRIAIELKTGNTWYAKARAKHEEAKTTPDQPELYCHQSGKGNPREDLFHTAWEYKSRGDNYIKRSKTYKSWSRILASAVDDLQKQKK